jgi:hypothetical protein
LALHHATIVDSRRSADINGTTIRFDGCISANQEELQTWRLSAID